MPRLIITEGTARGLERSRKFLKSRSPQAARRAADVISKHFSLLEITPKIGRPLDNVPELREPVIAFGDSGFVALYRFEPVDDTVIVLAFRHQKETGW